ncbi:MAG TPA: hypothetical protein VF491_17530 [Vicinamibacterales bacterium]
MIELLTFQPQSGRAMAAMQALKATATKGCVATSRYRGQSDVLLFWGPGAPERRAVMQQQLARGGRVLALDLSYWNRDRKFRVSIDAAHPQSWVMRRDWPANRLAADRVLVADRWNPDGPVIVAGIGRKARVQYGDAVERWEREMLNASAARWPGRTILYRRKQADAPVPIGVAMTSDGPIDDVLSGASLLVTWHSNVAVDAIRLGIPVICQDGAAAAVCASTFSEMDPQPLAPDVRDRFLRNLAWFQWAPSEARQFWAWVPEVLS